MPLVNAFVHQGIRRTLQLQPIDNALGTVYAADEKHMLIQSRAERIGANAEPLWTFVGMLKHVVTATTMRSTGHRRRLL
jgi:hypothetical protein